MAVRTLSYLDLTPSERSEGAKVARERLRALLINPLLDNEQRQVIEQSLDRLHKWEHGQIKVALPH